MDHLWRDVKQNVCANRQDTSIDALVMRVLRHLQRLADREQVGGGAEAQAPGPGRDRGVPEQGLRDRGGAPEVALGQPERVEAEPLGVLGLGAQALRVARGRDVPGRDTDLEREVAHPRPS